MRSTERGLTRDLTRDLTLGAGHLVTCSTDHTVRVWDYSAGVELLAWRHPDEFRCIAHKRSTGHIIAGTDQHHIVSFPLSDLPPAAGSPAHAPLGGGAPDEKAGAPGPALAAAIAAMTADAESEASALEAEAPA